jgi:hypothetical protein
MKPSGKIKDRAIGNLLRAQISKPSNPHQACTQFDPDLANAYVERKMTGPSRAGYETHLSECAPCRQTVVALARFAAAERAPISASEGSNRISWLSSVEAMMRGLSAPQWAMAAAAVVVFAISLPLILSRNQNDRALLAPSVTQTSAGETAQAEPHQVSPAAKISPEKPASLKSDDTNETSKSESKGLLAVNREREDRAVSAEQKKTIPENAPQAIDETQRKAENQVTPQAPAQPVQAAPETQQAKLDSDRVREQQGKDAAQPKPSPAKEQDADKEKSRRAESAAAPPPPPASSSSRMKAPVGRLGLRESAGDAVRPRADYRELRGKKFFLVDGTWTDKDYNQDKDLPIITLVRDSNVFKELLAKRSSLKPYVTFFGETERAIIVYKGTVYKLIPQQ